MQDLYCLLPASKTVLKTKCTTFRAASIDMLSGRLEGLQIARMGIPKLHPGARRPVELPGLLASDTGPATPPDHELIAGGLRGRDAELSPEFCPLPCTVSRGHLFTSRRTSVQQSGSWQLGSSSYRVPTR